MPPLRSFPSFPSSDPSPGARCLEILRSLQKEKTHTSERSSETETTIHPPDDRNDRNDQSPTAPLRLDGITLREVLGPRHDPAAVAALEAAVRAAIQQYRIEVATGVLGQDVLRVRGRPLSDYLDLDTLARLLGAAWPHRGAR